MITRGSARRKNVDIYKKVIELRKKGYSYTEIRKETGVAKSTINNWLTLSGLTLTKEHLDIQNKKRVENHVLGTEASRVTRARRKDEDIQRFILSVRKYFNDPFFVAGIMLYEAEGTKVKTNGFSNSDYRLIKMYINFLAKYFNLDKNNDLDFRIYIHEIRIGDLDRIKNYWEKELGIDRHIFRISWKHNIVSKKQENFDYVGQMNVRVRGLSYFTGKILAISDIILRQFIR